MGRQGQRLRAISYRGEWWHGSDEEEVQGELLLLFRRFGKRHYWVVTDFAEALTLMRDNDYFAVDSDSGPTSEELCALLSWHCAVLWDSHQESLSRFIARYCDA